MTNQSNKEQLDKTICSVLISSCDKYRCAWSPFFDLVKKYWSDCPFQFYLNTETLQFQNEHVISLNSDSACSWGNRLKNCLKRIESPYVIILLEDFFFQDHVDQQEIERCLNYMEKDKNLACIYFKKVRGFNTLSPDYPKYYIMAENKMYKTNLQAGLWRREDLLSFLGDDTPYTFEEEGYKRIKQNQTFLCSKTGSNSTMSHTVFPYLIDWRLGYGIFGGKWLWNNDKLLRKNNIETPIITLPRLSHFGYYKYFISKKAPYYFRRLFEKAYEILSVRQRVKE